MLSTLFLDMNAYFASVEQQMQPALRGRPVGVAPVLADSTCCIAASYEVKRYGVKTGTGVREARQLCPDIRIVEARPELYVQTHQKIIEAVETCLPVEKICSIDEMYCRLMGKERDPKRAAALGGQIKRAITERVGACLTCSVGVGPNNLLAKIAAEMQKPDGLTVITLDQLPEKLYPLELTDLPGIGKRMYARLLRHNVRTVEQLCALSAEKMENIWESVLGRQWWHLLRGDDLPEQPTHRRSVGHSHVLPPEFRTDEGSRAVMVRLIHKAAARLRHIGYWARRLDIRLGYLDRTKWSANASLGLSQDTAAMLAAFAELWESRPHGRVPIKAMMTLTGLVEDRYAPAPLFAQEQNRVTLARTIDQLNARFGRHAVYFGSMHSARATAPTRISFTAIPDLEVEDHV